MAEKRKSVIYIAGPMNASTRLQYHRNIERAREYMMRYLLRGYAVICPHTQGAYLNGLFGSTNDCDQEYEHWMAIDKELIRRSDMVVFIPGWRESKGAQIEYQFCVDNNIPYVFDDKEES